ncbi:DUF6261 family protein [Mangrovibacterium marinum]|uniref:Uncharacterized protein n=1 Tax=Mangrovibacterium marinum TaxID=1639118 RepID=A0A2T5C4S9_9BACT|nr:DUF6261 family protein [Mangrovibacterium marinum]PTN09841.1 hypothetical protein C8N47_103135 [Mangrovibacterium marinum]
METFKFNTLHVTNLSLNNLFSLSATTLSYATSAITEIGGIPQATYSVLETANTAMGARMNRSQKEGLTPQITAADQDRDACGRELKREIRTASESRSAAKSEPGKKLLLFLEPIWDFEEQALNTETEILDKTLTDYEADADLQAAATTLGIAELFTELRGLNTTFETLYNQRNSAEATSTGPSASELKPDTVAAYEAFCTSIEQAATYTPSTELTKLFNKMDALRKKYAALPKPEKKEEEEAEAGE